MMNIKICLIILIAFMLTGCVINLETVSVSIEEKTFLPNDVALKFLVSNQSQGAKEGFPPCIYSEDGIKRGHGGDLYPYNRWHIWKQYFSGKKWWVNASLDRGLSRGKICGIMPRVSDEKLINKMVIALVSLGAQQYE